MSYYEVPDQLVGVCTDNFALPAKGDIITINIDPSQLDLLLDQDTQVVVASQNIRANFFAGRSVNWYVDPVAGTGALKLEVTNLGRSASGTDGPWLVFAWTSPPEPQDIGELVGLRVDLVGDFLTGTEGTVRDSTNTVTIAVDAISKDTTAAFVKGNNNGACYNVAGAGTIAINNGSPNAVGTGTSFLSLYAPGSVFAFLHSDGVNKVYGEVLSVTDDLHLTLNGSYTGSNVSGRAHSLGFKIVAGSTTIGLPQMGGLAIREDATGDGDLVLAPVTAGGGYALPAGWTAFRKLCTVEFSAGGFGFVSISRVASPSHTAASNIGFDNATAAIDGNPDNVQDAIEAIAPQAANAPKAWLAATISPTLLTGNVSSVDTTADTITWSTDLLVQVTAGANATFPIIPAVGGTWPTGATTRGLLYGKFIGGSHFTFALYLNLSGAQADTSRINLTAAGSGTRTGHTLVIGGPIHGLDGECPIGGSGSYEANLGFALNFSPALDDGSFAALLTASGLVASTTTHGLTNVAPVPSSRSASAAVFRGNQNALPVASTITQAADAVGNLEANPAGRGLFQPGTWATQATTSFLLQGFFLR